MDIVRLEQTAMRSIAAFFLLVSFPDPGKAQSSQVYELLQKIAFTYSSIHEYVIVVTHQRTGGKEPIQTDHIADMQRGMAFPIERQRLQLTSVMLLARSGQAFHYQINWADGSDPILWITNGQTTWHYRSVLKEYTEFPAEPWPRQAGPGRGLPGIEWKYFTKFRAIAGMVNRAKLRQENIAPNDVCPTKTSIVDLQLQSGAADATEELHVLTRSGLVCESVVRSRRVWGGHVEYNTDTTTWSYRRISGKVDPKLFVFIPPKKVKK